MRTLISITEYPNFTSVETQEGDLIFFLLAPEKFFIKRVIRENTSYSSSMDIFVNLLSDAVANFPDPHPKIRVRLNGIRKDVNDNLYQRLFFRLEARNSNDILEILIGNFYLGCDELSSDAEEFIRLLKHWEQTTLKYLSTPG